MSSSHIHPRRRAASPRIQPPSLDGLAICKGATFHASKPPSAENDPVLNIATLPQRSPTSPEYLADVVAGKDAYLLKLLDSIDKKLEGDNATIPTDLTDANAFPVPRFLIAHAASGCNPSDFNDNILSNLAKKQQQQPKRNQHEHLSDSGLGTSVSGDSIGEANPMRQCRFCDSSEPGHADLHEAQIASKRSVYQSVKPQDPPHIDLKLSTEAEQKIKKFIIDPILAEDRLKDYHGLIKDIPQRIGDRAITCLRDLEKTLIYLAPVSTNFGNGELPLAYAFGHAKSKAKSAAAYLNFAETSIQCIVRTVDHLQERELRRPTDRPYTNNYFLDLAQQVRQYARIMAVSRQKQREGKPMSKEDWTPLVAPYRICAVSGDLLISLHSRREKLRLKGGLSQNGEPAELVRDMPNGEAMAIDVGKRKLSIEGFSDDAESSMARKRKCDIGKIDWRQCKTCSKWFKRPCDLTKHEKTHSRPWKCPEVGCKYHELGWPTEKERDRHINDKHTATPALYRCRFNGCSYTSKRESNCKQHMEKTHGYQYVRSKSRKGEHLTPISGENQESVEFSMPTPSSASAYQPLSTPSTTFNNPSPITSSENAFSPAATMDTGASNRVSPHQMDFSSMDGHDPNALFGHDAALFASGNDYMNEFSGDNTNLFNPTPPITDLNGDLMMSNCDPLFNNNTGNTLHLTPPMSDITGDRRNSDFSGLDTNISNDSWTAEFDFGEMNVNNPWPDVNQFFPQYGTGDPFADFGEMPESSAMAQALFADGLVRGEGVGNPNI